MQFNAQDLHYRQHFSAARFDVILAAGQPVGRLYVDRGEHEIRLIDIALLPEHRGRGIGGALIAELVAEAGAGGKTVAIHVEHHNPAKRLYERLGFRLSGGETGLYVQMQWRAEPGLT
jgi:ribosomal protein S18 acetylase RimI-like enzyme